MSRRRGSAARLTLSVALALGPLDGMADGFNIAAPDAAQTGLLFVFQGPESSSIGASSDAPFTVGGGAQDLDFFFEGPNNALLGTLRGAQLAVDVNFGGGSNVIDFQTQDNGIEVSAITLAVTGDGNRLNFLQEEGTLELREFQFNLELIGGANQFTVQSNEISQYAWAVTGADNIFSVTQTETLLTSQEMQWLGDQGSAAFDLIASSEITLATAVDGTRTQLTQRFERVDQAWGNTVVQGDDNVLSLSATNVSGLTYDLSLRGNGNAVEVIAENGVAPRFAIEISGDRNALSATLRDMDDASIRVLLLGSDSQLEIEQTPTPGS
jgi:hypothetical protein